MQHISDSGPATPTFDAPRLLTLENLYGEGLLFTSRLSVSQPGWLFPTNHAAECFTGLPLTVAGEMPVACSRSVVDHQAIAAIEEAGLTPGGDLRIYDSPAEYLEILREEPRLCVQHIHPPDEIRPERYWIKRTLLAFLNNKGKLHRIVPNPFVPKRRVLRSRQADFPERFPVMLKLASNGTSGGTITVRLCRDRAAFDAARRALRGGGRLLVEEYLPMWRNWCIQYAVLPDGSVEYLGATEQVVDEDGMYRGNWIEPSLTPSPEALFACRQTIERAAAMGYRGVAGFDTAELADGRVYVFDLNFRMNGSTIPLLHARRIHNRFGKNVFRQRKWTHRGGYATAIEVIRRWVGEGRFVPFYIYRPAIDGDAAMTNGILLGSSRSEVLADQAEWIAAGFE